MAGRAVGGGVGGVVTAPSLAPPSSASSSPSSLRSGYSTSVVPPPPLPSGTWARAPWPVPAPQRVFCNRTLDLGAISAVGFDMDYTLAQYIPETFERLAHDEAAKKLVERLGYPDWLLSERFDSRAVIRGLLIDTETGAVLKSDRHGYVKVAVLGDRPLSSAERRGLYNAPRHRPPVPLGSARFAPIDTLFSLGEAALFMRLAQAAESGERPGPPGGKSLAQVYADLRAAVDLCHRDGAIKRRVAENPAAYVHRDPALVGLLEGLREAGKKVFLATNSLWDYTNVVMTFLIDERVDEEARARADWLEHFDVVFTGTAKPGFFARANDLFLVDPRTGTLRNTQGGAPTLPLDRAAFIGPALGDLLGPADEQQAAAGTGGGDATADGAGAGGGGDGGDGGLGGASPAQRAQEVERRLIVQEGAEQERRERERSVGSDGSASGGASGHGAGSGTGPGAPSSPFSGSSVPAPSARPNVYQGGWYQDLHDKLSVRSGNEILYVGDHIYGDVLRSKTDLGWRTLLIIPELQRELQVAGKLVRGEGEEDVEEEEGEQEEDEETREQLGEGAEGAAAAVEGGPSGGEFSPSPAPADVSASPASEGEGSDADAPYPPSVPAPARLAVLRARREELSVRLARLRWEQQRKRDGRSRREWAEAREGSESGSAASPDPRSSPSSPSSPSAAPRPRPRAAAPLPLGISCAASASPELEIEALTEQLEATRAEIDRLMRHCAGSFHPVWGPLLKTGTQQSRYGHQVERYACIYTSHVGNLAAYPPTHVFQAAPDLMPHERD